MKTREACGKSKKIRYELNSPFCQSGFNKSVAQKAKAGRRVINKPYKTRPHQTIGNGKEIGTSCISLDANTGSMLIPLFIPIDQSIHIFFILPTLFSQFERNVFGRLF